MIKIQLFALADRFEACKANARVQVELRTPALLTKATCVLLVSQDLAQRPTTGLQPIQSDTTEEKHALRGPGPRPPARLRLQ